ncbi:fasciclin-like arabinogalactan protein 14 [Herrania umbratica]|uniref:Fasciclin-like arabinogalactan protein 14 n=1 Tax=Herrania umbratica TaxID=108875 RepID=A0A6J1B5A8_9ROSI|nr:fasciclin-like arabinogalactan protein 14 [Herrania umbratica]
MSPVSSPVVALFFSLFLLLPAADAFNITQILSQFSDFSTFNNYLIHTGVADQINSKQTVTVLVVANGNMSEVSGQSPDAMKKTLSVHVILDYFDAEKLKNLQNKTTLTLTTLYQQSGQAQNQQGFLNVGHVGNGGVAFGSAVSGSNLDSIFIKPVASQPYNISVLQISNIINVPSNSTTPSSPPAQAPASSPTTKPHPPAASPPRKVLAPAPSPKKSPPGKASPPPDAASPAASPPNPSNATAPSVAKAPAADTPAESASNPVADGPDSDEADNNSSSVSVTSGNYLAAILMMFTSAWFLLTMI